MSSVDFNPYISRLVDPLDILVQFHRPTGRQATLFLPILDRRSAHFGQVQRPLHLGHRDLVLYTLKVQR